MPEFVGSNVVELRDAVVGAARRSGFLFIKEIEELVDRYDQEFVGKGAECVVVRAKGGEGKVIAFDYTRTETAGKAKKLFYTQRILSTLFPHNFPSFFASFGGERSGTVRQEIRGKKSDFGYVKLDQESKYPFRLVREVVKELGMPIDFDDDFSGNFISGADGGVYYIDKPWFISAEDWDEGAIGSYMKDHDYDARSIRIVEKSIQRLKELKKG